MAVNLLFRVVADTADATRQLGKVGESAADLGATFGQKFGQNAFAQIKAFIGARAIAQVLSGAFTEGERIRKGAEKYGVFPEAFQIMEMAAAASGESLEEVRDVLEKATMTPRTFLQWQQLVADLQVEGKVLSAQQVANLARWEAVIEKMQVGTKGAIGEFFGGTKEEIATRALRNVQPAIAPVVTQANVEFTRALVPALDSLIRLGEETIKTLKEKL